MDKTKKEYLWYAAYGSNINYDRFLLYITGGTKKFYDVEIVAKGCFDKSLPIKDQFYKINHPIYFAKHSSKWSGGVAFLNTRISGLTYGRVYLITKDQFQAIKAQEGSWYSEEINLGILEGYPVKTFTGFHEDIEKPSISYLNTINEALTQMNCPLIII